MKKLVPIFLVVLGVSIGAGAGFFLAPAKGPNEEASELASENPEDDEEELETTANEEISSSNSFVKMNNQFVVPVVDEERVKALVVMSISLQVAELEVNSIYEREPVLRDYFLQVLFDHAYLGGFSGIYTEAAKMDVLRNSLLSAAREIAGDKVQKVLITDIVRQDL